MLALDAPAVAVLAFEVLLNASVMFHHGHVRLPDRLDRILCRVVVTPDMHRIHHPILRREADGNHRLSLARRDRLFGIYQALPAAGQPGLTTGIAQSRNSAGRRPDRMPLQPSRRSGAPVSSLAQPDGCR